MDSPKNESAREPYEPPMIEDVPIRSDEQLLAGCKLPRAGGPGHGPPAGCGLQCRLPGQS
jgi:hypothetical protein